MKKLAIFRVKSIAIFICTNFISIIRLFSFIILIYVNFLFVWENYQIIISIDNYKFYDKRILMLLAFFLLRAEYITYKKPVLVNISHGIYWFVYIIYSLILYFSFNIMHSSFDNLSEILFQGDFLKINIEYTYTFKTLFYACYENYYMPNIEQQYIDKITNYLHKTVYQQLETNPQMPIETLKNELQKNYNIVLDDICKDLKKQQDTLMLKEIILKSIVIILIIFFIEKTLT